MNASQEQKLNIKLIANPNTKRSELSFKVEPHQKFSSVKNTVNGTRQNINKYVGLKNVSLITLASQLGLNYQTLRKFTKSENIATKNAVEIFNAFQYIDFKKLTIETNKANKIKDNEPKSEIDFKGDEKGKIRDILIYHLSLNRIKSGKFFTLPSSECIFELEMNFEFDNEFHYLACECKPIKYAEMQQTIVNKKLLMSTHFGYSNELTSLLPTNSLSHGFWDYCGVYASHENEVKQVLLNKTVIVGGLIAFTFCQRDNATLEYHRSILKEIGSNDIPTVKGGIKHKLNALLSDNYIIEEFRGYKDGAPMLFVLLKRIK